MSAVEIDVDIEVMITLVQARPELWDKSSNLYKDRVAKRNGWDEVCAALNEGYVGMESKKKAEIGEYHSIHNIILMH